MKSCDRLKGSGRQYGFSPQKPRGLLRYERREQESSENFVPIKGSAVYKQIVPVQNWKKGHLHYYQRAISRLYFGRSRLQALRAFRFIRAMPYGKQIRPKGKGE